MAVPSTEGGSIPNVVGSGDMNPGVSPHLTLESPSPSLVLSVSSVAGKPARCWECIPWREGHVGYFLLGALSGVSE